MSDALGSGVIGQKSIGENVNINQINNIYLSIIQNFNKFIEDSDDIYA